MLIGLISDSHDNLQLLRRAVERFAREQAELVLHAGDYVAPFAVKLMNDLPCEWAGVLGNNDGERAGLAAASEGKVLAERLEREAAGKRLLVVHDLSTLSAAERRGRDVVVHGHSHRAEVKRQGGLLLVNPGECCGWLSGKGTVAMLDTERMDAKIVDL